MKSQTILVVDDEPDILELLGILLKGAGYRVLAAPGARAALDLLERETVDFILLDLMMPEVDGYAVLERLRAHAPWRNIPVYILTAKNDVVNIAHALDLGAGGFLVKPFDTENLLRVVAACLSGNATAFYSAGNTEPAQARDTRHSAGESPVAWLQLAEPRAPYSAVAQACEDQQYNLLSIWSEVRDDVQHTTALLDIANPEHFGGLLNRVLAHPEVQILHCAIYRALADIPLKKMEGA
jgi:DNA-binding response OmpR family regulator